MRRSWTAKVVSKVSLFPDSHFRCYWEKGRGVAASSPATEAELGATERELGKNIKSETQWPP